MGLKENIKMQRQVNGLTLEELSLKIGVSKQTVQKYESGVISNVPSDKIEKMADALNTTPAYLMGWTNDPTASFTPKSPAVDVLAYDVEGDSMEPRIFDGDTVIVKKQKDVNSGEIAMIKVDGQAVVKKVVKQENGLLLVGLNSAVYTPKFYTYENAEIIGKVVEIRGKVDGWDK